MKREDFVLKYHHLIAGMILDAATGRREGPAMSLWLQQVMSRVDALLGQAHVELTQPAVPATGLKVAKT